MRVGEHTRLVLLGGPVPRTPHPISQIGIIMRVTINSHVRSRPRYGFLMFLIDLVLIGITGGVWALWIAFKFLRTGHR